ncbi:sensor histidine kinase [Bythopirellula polymerisocia]|uniref:histidine kinase n=1 Tax=Bythopirellula polymerisocia TaxID=2528003 RepID=A0A5C6CEV4_9BACT|nr:ATP-binding protein [Bythopirellula polymerisocia]TWU22632.1 Wide host range VirA protein [Bythopirellula polymerisocia]
MSGRNLTPEQEIELLKRQLAQTQRMAALGELAGTTTHEFNNVLMTILNYAKLGLRHKDEPTRDKALTKILAAAQRAEKITNSVLGLARNRQEEFAPTQLSQLINESLILLEREMTKYRVNVRREFAEVPCVRAIGNQIQQVLLNLMTNARQAMPMGGELLLQLAHDGASNSVDLTIRDTGSGIPREQLPKIFDRYFSTKSGPDETGKGGTGVGLATCKDIIDAHQGRIRVQSTVGRGTAFVIRLPVFQQKAQTVPLPKLGVPTGETRGEVVGG